MVGRVHVRKGSISNPHLDFPNLNQTKRQMKRWEWTMKSILVEIINSKFTETANEKQFFYVPSDIQISMCKSHNRTAHTHVTQLSRKIADNKR